MRQHAGGATASSAGGHANQSRAAQTVAALPGIGKAAKALESARALVAGPTATLLNAAARTRHRLIARAHATTWELHRQPWLRFPSRGYQSAPAESCLTRLETVAGVLAAVGAITAEKEQDVVGGFRAALAARSRIEQEGLLSYHGLFGGHPMRRPTTGTAAPSGPPRAIPVGASATGEIAGVPIRFCLGIVIVDQAFVTLTMHARFLAELEERDPEHVDPVFHALSETTAVDDRGGTYHADFSGGGGGGEWDGRLHLYPTPAPSVRWLDVTLPGARAVRVHLDVPPQELQITMERVATSAADRFLDAQTLELLRSAHAHMAWSPDEQDDEPTLFWIASHLLAAGVLTTSSPSLRRLAAVAERKGERLPAQLSMIQPGVLPADWLSLQAADGREDGPAGMIPVAAVLPEVDGTRCVIAELTSEAAGATLQVHCEGWPEPRRHGMVRIEQFWWSARDDLGGPYIVGEGGWSASDGEADLDLELSPAINPLARVLDITMTGATTQVTVSVPLDWQEAL